MAVVAGSVGDEVLALLIEVELEEFFDKIRNELQVTRLSHFSHVEPDDLAEIGMGKPAIRRLLKAAKQASSIAGGPSSRKLGNFVKLFRTSSAASSSSAKPSAVPPPACLISASDLSLCETLGCGHFGVVKKAIWRKSDANKKAPNNEFVAVKILRGELANDKLLGDLIAEVAIMHKLDHPNLVKLHGVCFDTHHMLVAELAPLGSLLEYLRAHKNGGVVVTRLLSYAIQLANALAYLESKNFLHRDIALRNVLLASEDALKLCDFGLARILPNCNDHYNVTNPQRQIPYAWSAPESLKFGEFTHASDTWMYGVAVWEMFSFGDEPWRGQRCDAVIVMIDNRKRLPKPVYCPMAIYQMLLQCWRTDPENRPTFAAIGQYLSSGYFFQVKAKADYEDPYDDGKIKMERGDKIFVIDGCNEKRWWYGQDKRTLQFGYFLRCQVDMSRELSKDDISGPINGTFVHNSHAGVDGFMAPRTDLIDLKDGGNDSSAPDQQPEVRLVTPTKLATRKNCRKSTVSMAPSAPPLTSAFTPPQPSDLTRPDYENSSSKIASNSSNIYCDEEKIPVKSDEKKTPGQGADPTNLLDFASPPLLDKNNRCNSLMGSATSFHWHPNRPVSAIISSGEEKPPSSASDKTSLVPNLLQELNSQASKLIAATIPSKAGGYSKLEDDDSKNEPFSPPPSAQIQITMENKRVHFTHQPPQPKIEPGRLYPVIAPNPSSSFSSIESQANLDMNKRSSSASNLPLTEVSDNLLASAGTKTDLISQLEQKLALRRASVNSAA